MPDLTSLINSHNNNTPAGQVAQWRLEMDEHLRMMVQWHQEEPSLVLEEISSIAARLIEIRCQVVRSESRAMQAFRTKELDPVLAQVEFQFKVTSRRLSSQTLDWETSGRQAT